MTSGYGKNSTIKSENRNHANNIIKTTNIPPMIAHLFLSGEFRKATTFLTIIKKIKKRTTKTIKIMVEKISLLGIFCAFG